MPREFNNGLEFASATNPADLVPSAEYLAQQAAELAEEMKAQQPPQK